MLYRTFVRPLLKRCFDLVVSAILIIVLAPLMLIVAVVIKSTSVGNVFFLQERYTRNMKKFLVIKFRTMENGEVTRVGAALRKFGIDEIPQLLNVWKGEMSLVGPRAHWVQQAEDIIECFPGYANRFLVKAGITGPAQIFGHSVNDPKSTKRAIVYDTHYCNNPSLRRDLMIIVGTVKILIRGQRY